MKENTPAPFVTFLCHLYLDIYNLVGSLLSKTRVCHFNHISSLHLYTFNLSK